MDNDKKQDHYWYRKVVFVFSNLVYFFAPGVSIWCAERFYWRFEGFLGSAEQIVLFVIVVILQALVVWSHFVAKHSDPGFIGVLDYKQGGVRYSIEGSTEVFPGTEHLPKLCSEPSCRALKVDGVHHCSMCRRCVYMMDHHCMWTGNCVARNNFKYFFIFTFCLVLQCAIGFGVAIYNKTYFEEEKSLQTLQVNPIFYYSHFSPMGSLLNEKFLKNVLNDEEMKKIQKLNAEKMSPEINYFDCTAMLINIASLFYCLIIHLYFMRGIWKRELYID